MLNQGNQNTIPQKLTALREYHKLALPVFANALGINPGLVEKWERGFAQPDQQSLKRIADYYKIDVGYFFGPFAPVRTLYSGRDPAFAGANNLEKKGKTQYSFGPSVGGPQQTPQGQPPQMQGRPNNAPPPQQYQQHQQQIPASRAPAPLPQQQQQYAYTSTTTSYNMPAPVNYAPVPHTGYGQMPPPPGSYRSITVERTFPLDKWIMAGHLLVLLVPFLCMLFHFFNFQHPDNHARIVQYTGFMLLSGGVGQARELVLRIGLWAFVVITAVSFVLCVLRLITADGKRSPFDFPIKLLNYLLIVDFIVLVVAMFLFFNLVAYGYVVFMIMFLIMLMYLPVSMGGWKAFSLAGRDD